MWKRNQPESTPSLKSSPAKSSASAAPTAQRQTLTATIGPSITIKGDISGEEDLVIQGQIEGEIKFNSHNVTVGRNGRVQADVYGKTICIEGEVFGNLWGQDAVVIRQTGKVQGNLTAPRITLEDGSSFRGAIDMQSPEARGRKQQEQGQAKSPPAKGSASSQPARRPAV